MQVLLLNISYEPIRLLQWKTAVSAWVTGKVEIISTYSNIPLRSMSIQMEMPAVVRLTSFYHRFSEVVTLDRYHVYTRDQFTCQYCRQKFREAELTYDHVLPRSRGGKTNWYNIVTACVACNQLKADLTPEEAQMPLLKKPVKPTWMPQLLVDAIQFGRVPKQWAYWIEWLTNAGPNSIPVLEFKNM